MYASVPKELIAMCSVVLVVAVIDTDDGFGLCWGRNVGKQVYSLGNPHELKFLTCYIYYHRIA